jgi:hypothetical protein
MKKVQLFGMAITLTAVIVSCAPSKPSDSAQQVPNINDLQKRGGDPNALTLSGIIIADPTKGVQGLNPKISVSFSSGKNWQGVRPPLGRDLLAVTNIEGSTKVSSSEYLSFGCSDEELSNLPDLSKGPLKKADVSEFYKTDSVLKDQKIEGSVDVLVFCGESSFDDMGSVALIANSTYLMSATVKVFPKLAHHFSIDTGKLILSGANKITSDDETLKSKGDFLSGTVGFGVEQAISGDGTLKFEMVGADYQAAWGKFGDK